MTNKLIVGLGNPGKKYEKTRHNVGYLVLEKLALEISKSEFLISKQAPNPKFQTSKKAKAEYLSFRMDDERIELIKPLTFMNDSGFSVSYARNKHKIPVENIYIIHDDLDIKLGKYKIQKGVGPRLHNGISSIEKHLGTKDFWRVRVGVENRSKKFSIFNFQFSRRISGEKYVLQRFGSKEYEIVNSVTDNIINELIVSLGITC
ncbi:aminoacyl-tRNA hydrolase [Patescibacteria group bacterium]